LAPWWPGARRLPTDRAPVAGFLPVVAVYTGGVLKGVTLTQISSGATGFALALGSTGAAYGWGVGTSGQLGNNSTTSSDVPVSVQALLA